MYLLETNRIHEMRDMQYFEPEKGNLVPAIDSVELFAIKHVVPLQTTALPIANQNQQMNNQGLHQGLVKGQVQFSEQVEVVPESDEYESDDDLHK
jgi:hypothetical protein